MLIAAVFCMMNRYVDGLATIAPDDPEVYAAFGERFEDTIVRIRPTRIAFGIDPGETTNARSVSAT